MNEIFKKIVEDIISDITDRSGFGNSWEEIDLDTQNDIKEAWISILKDNLTSKLT